MTIFLDDKVSSYYPAVERAYSSQGKNVQANVPPSKHRMCLLSFLNSIICIQFMDIDYIIRFMDAIKIFKSSNISNI